MFKKLDFDKCTDEQLLSCSIEAGELNSNALLQHLVVLEFIFRSL